MSHSSSPLISPTSDGAGAAVLASEAFVRKHHLEKQAVEIVAQEMVTDLASTFEENSCIKMVGIISKVSHDDTPSLTFPPLSGSTFDYIFKVELYFLKVDNRFSCVRANDGVKYKILHF